MSMGGGGSAPQPPRLKTVDTGSAANLVKDYNSKAYAASDAAYANPGNAPGVPQTGPLVGARDFAIGDLLSQSGGGLAGITDSTLTGAGFGAEASKLAGPTELATSRNLGQPLVAKELRDRNFASSFLAQNPERNLGLTGDQALQILMANTGNINAYNQAIFGTQQNAFNAEVAQRDQNIGAASNLFSGFTSALGSFLNKQDPYTDPFGGVYGQLFFGNNSQPVDLGNLPVSNLSAAPPTG